ncbi:MAG TPA: acyl carrier protein [Cyclobacteriaceae bacterium]|nr:acyl carrier protein [Cyclobacteriaceae bacterium]
MKEITKEQIVQFLKEKIAAECQIPIEDIKTDVEFSDFRMDSVNAIFIMDELENYLEVELNPLYFWDYRNIDAFTNFIFEKHFNSM